MLNFPQNVKDNIKFLIHNQDRMPIITPLDFEEEIRKINCQASKLPPITERNGYENLCRTEDKLREYISLPDIFSTAKRRTRTRRKSKKNDAKNTNMEEEKKAKKKKPLAIGKTTGEITKSFSIVSSPGGSNYSLIARRSSSRVEELFDVEDKNLWRTSQEVFSSNRGQIMKWTQG